MSIAQEDDQGRHERRSDSTPVMMSASVPAIQQNAQMVAGITTFPPQGRTRSSSVAVQESNPQSQDKALGDSRAGVSIDPMPPQPSAVATKNQPSDFLGNEDGGHLLETQQGRHAWIEYNIPKILNACSNKEGLAFLSGCSGTPGTEDYIQNCTAIEKMKYCLETQLGYVTVVVGESVTRSLIISLLRQVEKLSLPINFNRVFFYFFGHGTEETIQVADGCINRSEIISGFQSICPQERDVFKIFMFDCCRERDITTLKYRKPWSSGGEYPDSTNTLVINATEKDFKAYYGVTNGCGLMTHFFTELAPTMNDSIRELLAAIRVEIRSVAKRNSVTQVLVYEDKLMGKCNLLAESHGEARVVPTGVGANAAVISTNIHFKFDAAVEPRVAEFRAEISTCSHDQISIPAPPSERVATIRNIEPETEYAARVIVKYKDGKEVESENHSFKTPARESPFDIKVQPEYPGSPSARVNWKYNGATSDLDKFRVTIQTDDEDLTYCNVPKDTFGALIKGFVPEEKHHVTVAAVYRDGKTTQHDIEFQHSCRCVPEDIEVEQNIPALNHATVRWSFPDCKEVRQFNTSVKKDENQIEEKKYSAAASARCQVITGLSPSTKYIITIEAEFTDGFNTTKSHNYVNCIGPQYNLLEWRAEQKSAKITITQPSVPQEDDHPHLTPTSIKYSVTEDSEQDGGESGSSKNKVKSKNFKDFRPPYNGNSASSGQPQEREIPNLKPQTKYVLRARAEYGGKNYVYGDPIVFQTAPYTVCQKVKCCSVYIICYFLLICALVCSIFLCGSFGAYQTILQRTTTCSTEYVLTSDSVQCGAANSLQYETIQVGGDQQQGDTLLGVMQAWSVKESHLVFYSDLKRPINVTANASEHERILLQGWQIYTWTGSIIYGYCCITNNGVKEVTAKLYIFISDTDAINFVNGQGTQNALLYDSIQIPPQKQQCFRNWGAGAPFRVTHSSYHFIGVDMPGNVTYSSNVTVLQKYVDGNDYGRPHFFKYDNTTKFSISRKLTDRKHEDYVVICKAPLYQPNISPVIAYTELKGNRSLASNVGSESLHLTSCKKPYHWREFALPIALGFGLLLFILFVILCHLTSYCMLKRHRNRLFLSCKCSCSPRGYTGIQ